MYQWVQSLGRWKEYHREGRCSDHVPGSDLARSERNEGTVIGERVTGADDWPAVAAAGVARPSDGRGVLQASAVGSSAVC